MRRSIQISLAIAVLAAGLAVILSVTPGDGLAQQEVKIDPATHKGYVETVPDSSVKFEMVPIPGGTFLMGSPPSEKGRADDEGPLHPVQIRPFWMGKMEVSWDEFDVYWKSEDQPRKDKEQRDAAIADAITRPTPPYADETFGHGREGHPVLCISHHTCMEYCRWLSWKTGKTYRLPTEAEWEYAARAGTQTKYYWGDDPKDSADYAWFKPNSDEGTQKIGQKKPNPWGLHDILGNLSEWCIDHYQKDYSKFPADKLTLAPVILPTEKRFPHVYRGGSWADEPDRLRSAARNASHKDFLKRDPQRPQSIWWLTDAEFVGFRVVRPVLEQKELKGLRSKVTKESD